MGLEYLYAFLWFITGVVFFLWDTHYDADINGRQILRAAVMGGLTGPCSLVLFLCRLVAERGWAPNSWTWVIIPKREVK